MKKVKIEIKNRFTGLEINRRIEYEIRSRNVRKN